MKKFVSLPGIVRAASILFFAAAPLAVACNISELDNRVTDLENRVDGLEAEIEDQIASLQGMLDENIYVVSCSLDEADGVYTIVLSSGETIEIAKAGDEESSSVIGVFEEDGKYWWTLNGEPMQVGGNNVPVSVTPGIRVNSVTNEWEVSPDGGDTWLPTGILATNGASIFEKVEEDEAYVYFTLGDGSKVQIPKLLDFECSVLSGKQYFSAGQTRSIELSLKNVSKTAVMKPDGWKASVEGSVLSITAPAAANSYAETSGKVSVLAVSPGGEFSISEVIVEVGDAPHEISISSDKRISISVNESVCDWFSGWNYFYAGISRLAEFSPEAVVSAIEMNTRPVTYQGAIDMSFSELYGGEYDKEESYVVWCIDSWADLDSYENLPLDPTEMMYTTILGIDVKMTASDITFEDARIDVQVTGVSSYYAAVLPKQDYNPENIIGNIEAEGGEPAYEILTGNYNGLLSEYGAPEDYYGTIMANEIISGTEYIAFVIPVKDGGYTEEDIYTCEIPISDITMDGSVTVSLSDIVPDFTSVSATVTPGEGYYKYYVSYLSEADYAQYETDEELLDYLFSGTGRTASSYAYSRTGLETGSKGYIVAVALDRSGKAGPIVRQEVVTGELTYSDITVSATSANVTFNSADVTFSGQGIVSYRYLYTQESGLKSYPYGNYSGRNDAQVEQLLAMDDYMNIKYVQAGSDGSATVSLSALNTNVNYYVFVVGVDASGKPAHMVTCTFNTAFSNFADEGTERYNANYEANKPVITNLRLYDPTGETEGFEEPVMLSDLTELPNEYNLTVMFDAEVGDKCAKFWVGIQNPSYISINQHFNDETLLSVLSYGRLVEYTEAGTDIVHGDIYNNNFSNLYLVWQDDEGYMYPVEIIDLHSFLKPLSEPEPEI